MNKSTGCHKRTEVLCNISTSSGIKWIKSVDQIESNVVIKLTKIPSGPFLMITQ